ncbi:Hypothetical protein R9X50_00232500 [Acrodontium crateriforme]|uniref:WD repeat-containing protein 82 n=1 Tax=Acrodontium crateriforme TaxID=150365 RepID=A0AAQ3R3E1_9PEZI|nr:Hypothetical protein R9X50_00232500 [Acrodontium crateriforme]
MAIETSKVQDILPNFRPTRQFKAPPNNSYTSIDFDNSGEFLLLSRTDDTIQLFNVKAGAHAKELKSQKYGSALARFTHHSTSILYASTKVDDGIRYLSMHDNTFIRYFKGHEGRVTSLSMSPGSDNFLTASMDNTVRLWDIRSPNAQGMLNFDSPYLACYDPSASIFAVGSPPTHTVLLYDLKNYDKPPFATFDLFEIEKRYAPYGQKVGKGWTAMEFSNNGKYFLISTNGPGHYLLDAYSGELVHYLHRSSGLSGRLAPGDATNGPDAVYKSAGEVYTQGDATFTPDGRYVISGGGTQTGILIWDCQETPKSDNILEPISELPSSQSAAVVAYNPRHNLIASADKEVLMWLPDPELA